MGFRQSVRETLESIKKWTWHHGVVFVMTFLSYSFFHACRKAYSNVKDSMAKSWCPDPYVFPYDVWQKENLFANYKDADVFLAELDTIFMFIYAVGLFLFGILGDRINLKLMLATGMLGSALSTFLFGYISVILNIKNLWFYRFIWGLNGLFQSTGWPATVAIMGNWFSKKSSGLVFGFWSANASVGNIFGSMIVASVLEFGYEYGMLLNSVLLFCGGVVVAFCLIIHPNDVGLSPPDETGDVAEDFKNHEDSSDSSVDVVIEKPKAISFFQALLIPGVISYSLSYACLKLVNYTLFFWLPTYLQQGLHWDDAIADRLSNFYDVGGICAGVFAGIVTDMMGYRSPTVCLMLLLSTGCLYMYLALGTTYTSNVALMLLLGFMIGGPANTISTAITADLGKHEKIRGSAEALSTVTGIIDGSGSFGAAIGQYLVGVINKYLGWHYVFYFLILMAFLSFVCILPILVKESKDLLRKIRKSPKYEPILTSNNAK